MIVIVTLATFAALGIGFLIGRDWSKVDASESFEEGRLEGYMEGYDVGSRNREDAR